MEHDKAERNGAKRNIYPTPLFGYFIKNILFHHIPPKLDETKNRHLDEIG